MNKRNLLFVICFFLSFSAAVQAADIVKWSLPKTKTTSEEFLLYRLSYRGILTAFVWKDIADTAIIANSKSVQFNKYKSCQLSLKMSTEDFMVSEIFSPMRYHWRTTISPDLSRIFMFEEINKNEDDSHQVVWLNQKKKRLEIYRKRKKILVSAANDIDYFDDDDSDVSHELVVEWEKEGKKKAPKFISRQSGVEGKIDYLVYDKAIKFAGKAAVFDPLSLIYSVRWYDYDAVKNVDFTISYKDSFRKYQVFLEARESIDIGDESVDTLKIEIRRDKKEARDDEGYMIMWLSDDERRIPLQYMVNAKIGKIKLKMDALNLKNYQTPVDCIVQKPTRMMTAGKSKK